jgi:hypothetical protein
MSYKIKHRRTTCGSAEALLPSLFSLDNRVLDGIQSNASPLKKRVSALKKYAIGRINGI